MTRNADMMYDTKPPSPHRSRVILSDGSIRKVQFVGKLDLVFHSRTDHPVTLHDVSFVPDLGFNLFSFHVVQEKLEIILNKTGAHLLNGRLVFPRRSNGSSLRATRVMPGVHASASNALATFADPASPVQYRSVTSPVAHETSSTSVLANVSPKYIPSRCLNPRATSLDFALLTQPNSSDFQLNNHLASMTLPVGC